MRNGITVVKFKDDLCATTIKEVTVTARCESEGFAAWHCTMVHVHSEPCSLDDTAVHTHYAPAVVHTDGRWAVTAV